MKSMYYKLALLILLLILNYFCYAQRIDDKTASESRGTHPIYHKTG